MNLDNLLPLVPFMFLLIWIAVGSRRVVACPDCGRRVGGLAARPIKTMRQFVFDGDGSCRRCGCTMDVEGNKIAPDTPISSVRIWALCLALVVLATIVCTFFIVVRPGTIALDAVAAGPRH